jgi:hypothetical protein
MEGFNSEQYQFISIPPVIPTFCSQISTFSFHSILHFLLMDELYTQFRANVFGSHFRAPWAMRLQDILDFVTEYPQYAMMIGLVPCNATSFYVNSHQEAHFSV